MDFISAMFVRRFFQSSAPRASAFQKLIADAKKVVPEITPKEAAEQPSTVIVDTREQSEWKTKRASHPNVVYIGKGLIERDIEKVVKSFDTPIVTYCAGGFRSLLAGEALKRMGYTNVKSMIGGLGEWEKSGLPVDSSPK